MTTEAHVKMVSTIAGFFINKEELNTMLNIIDVEFNVDECLHEFNTDCETFYDYMLLGDLKLKPQGTHLGYIYQVNLTEPKSETLLDSIFFIEFPEGCPDTVYKPLTLMLNIEPVEDEYTLDDTIAEIIQAYILKHY